MSADLHFSTASGQPVQSPEFNVSNTNAVAILAVLGFDSEKCNNLTCSITELRRSASQFLNSDLPDIVDHGQPNSRTESGNFNLTVIGRRSGYLVEKIRRIDELCEDAQRNGATTATFS